MSPKSLRRPTVLVPLTLLQNTASKQYISQLDIQGDGATTSSTVFTSNRSQAVRLPKAVAFPDDVHQVGILKIGCSRVIVPQGRRWDYLFCARARISWSSVGNRRPRSASRSDAHMLDTNICIYV
jgi:antitoxin VapB